MVEGTVGSEVPSAKNSKALLTPNIKQDMHFVCCTNSDSLSNAVGVIFNNDISAVCLIASVCVLSYSPVY